MLRLCCTVIALMLFSRCSSIGDMPLLTNQDTEQASLSILISPGMLLKKGNLAKQKGMGKPAVPLDSILISISATDMPAETWHFGPDLMQVELAGLFPGLNRLVEVSLIDTSGRVAYEGISSEVDILTGGKNAITVECRPCFSQLTVLFPLGVGSNSGISKGILNLIHNSDTFSSDLVIAGETGEFFFPNIKGGLKYEIHLELRLPDGKIVYREAPGDSVQVPFGVSAQYNMSLMPQLSNSHLSLKINPVPEVKVALLPLDAKKRKPSADEVAITEFYPEPLKEEGAAKGEWLEIYNRTLDTLILDDCRIAKTRTSAGLSTRHLFVEGTALIPGQVVVFGRDSVPFRDYPYAFSLSNTKQSILLLCEQDTGDVLIDSVSYTAEYAPADSIPSKTGFVSSLDYASLGGPPIAANWCLTSMQAGTVGTKASPGRLK